jgi:hypothetical protein
MFDSYNDTPGWHIKEVPLAFNITSPMGWWTRIYQQYSPPPNAQRIAVHFDATCNQSASSLDRVVMTNFKLTFSDSCATTFYATNTELCSYLAYPMMPSGQNRGVQDPYVCPTSSPTSTPTVSTSSPTTTTLSPTLLPTAAPTVGTNHPTAAPTSTTVRILSHPFHPLLPFHPLSPLSS